MFEVNNENIGTTCEICLKLTIKTLKYFTTGPSASILDFEQVNTSWVLQAGFTQRHTSKIGDFVKIFNSLNLLKVFTEIWQNLYQSVN